MKRIALFWFFIFCIFSQINIGAKENTHFLNYRFRWLNTSAGLSQNTVNCIARDKAGFTWIGTNHGLNRFDGQNIQSFFRNSKDGFALSNDIVRCISILKNKTIIIGTLDGVTFFEADKKSSIIIHIDEKTKNSEDKIITNIFEISANRIFIGTTGGLFLFDAEAKKILKHWGNDFFHLRKNLQYFNVWNFIYSQNKIIGFIENKVYEFKVDKNEFRKEGVAENPLTVFCGVKPIPHSEKLLCYGQNVLAVYNSISKKFEENLYPYLKKYNPEGWPESASFMNKNSLWVGLNKTGLIQFSKTKNGWETNSVLLNNTPDFSGKNRFSSLLQDDFGLLWVGTDYGAFYNTPNQYTN
ncbi:MAG: hypothetical protein NTX03_05900 [Bacteroidetes bacterium]|nr:hypothetical protein [Bacteroidota bacterium]